MRDFLDKIRAAAGGETNENSETTNLRLTSEQFADKMLAVPNGMALINLLNEGEINVCKRMGLISSVEENGEKLFFIPRWNNFISHLQICHSVFSQNPE